MTEGLPSSPASSTVPRGENEFELLCALTGVELAPERDRAHCELESLKTRLERIPSPGGAPWSSSARGAQSDRTRSRASTRNRALSAICVRREPAAQPVVHRRTGAHHAALRAQAVAGSSVQRAGAGAIGLPRCGAAKFFGSRLPDFSRGLRDGRSRLLLKSDIALPRISLRPSSDSGCRKATSARLTAQRDRTWSNCSGRCCRISMQWICAWRICWRARAGQLWAGARCLACLPKIRCWCCACMPQSIFGRA